MIREREYYYCNKCKKINLGKTCPKCEKNSEGQITIDQYQT